jgi:hypothetical protein
VEGEDGKFIGVGTQVPKSATLQADNTGVVELALLTSKNNAASLTISDGGAKPSLATVPEHVVPAGDLHALTVECNGTVIDL